nr:DUF5808 domain-containing protein [Clostridioides difficile]
MNKIECFTIFSTLILMYAAFYFMPYLVGKNQIYGVSINQEHRNYPEFIVLDKKFKKLLSLGFILIFILLSALIFMFDKGEFSYAISIIGFILYEGILYIYIHKKVKMTKSKICSNSSKKNTDSKLVIDMDFINEKNKIIQKFKILYLIPILLTFGISAFILLNYNQLPDLITTHSTITGQPDGFIEKSYLGVFKLVGLEFCIMILLYITSIGAIKSRIKIDTNKIKESKNKNIKYLNKIGYLFFILMTMMMVQFFMLFSSLKTNANLLTITSIMMLLVIIYLIVTYINSPNLKSNSSYTPDNDEKYWMAGIIYNNPNDPSLMVDKRFGIGWTINFGNPIGKILYILIAVFLIFSLVSVIKSLLL